MWYQARFKNKEGKIMSTKPVIQETKIDEEKHIGMISLDELTAENDEIIASIESLKESNSAIRTGYSEILSSTKELLASVKELASLIK
jgi:hypothetical protein